MVTFLGLPNFSTLTYVTTSTSGALNLEVADTVSSYLKTEEPSELARLTTLDPQHTQWAFSTSGIPITVEGIHVVNHNLTKGSQIRATGNFSGAVINSPLVLPPNAILDSSNLSGAVTSVDEDIYTPDGNTIGPTSSVSAWSVRFGFATPGAQPLGGEDMVCWVFRARRIAGSTLVSYPVVWCELYENGVLVRELGWRAVTETAAGGQILIFPFSLEELADETCANLEVRLHFTPGSGTGGQYAVLESLSFYYEVVTPSKDTGWITLTEDDRQGPPLRKRDWHTLLEGWDDVLGYTIMFRGDLSVHDPLLAVIDDFDEVPYGVIRQFPDAFVQAGVVNAGATLQCSEGIAQAQRLAAEIEIREIEGETDTGQTYGLDAWRRVLFGSPLTFYLTEDELDVLRDQLLLRRGHTGAFSLLLNPGSTRPTDSLWCTITDFGAPEWIGIENGANYYAVGIAFAERL